MAQLDQTAKPKKRMGRPPGARNKRLMALEEKLVADLARAAEEMDAATFLQRVYQDPKTPLALRIDAAKAVFRTEKPVLAALAVQTNTGSLADRMLAAQERLARLGFSVKTIEGRAEAPQSALQASPASPTAPDSPTGLNGATASPEPVLDALDNTPPAISPARLRVLHELAARRSAPAAAFEDLI